MSKYNVEIDSNNTVIITKIGDVRQVLTITAPNPVSANFLAEKIVEVIEIHTEHNAY